MSFKTKKKLYRIISAMMGLIIVIMAFSFDTIKVNAETDYNAFPSSYRAKLRELNKLHPNWIFVPFNTGLDWNEAVNAEAKGNRSAIQNRYETPDSWKSKDSDVYNPETGEYRDIAGWKWIRASRECVEYYMYPVNYFDEVRIFVFEQLSYNPSLHNIDGVEAIIANSWMSHRPLEDQENQPFNYSNFFIQNAMDSGVSPYHLASRVIQEMGRGDVATKTNNNPLISNDKGVYNYYNIGAYGKTNEEVKIHGWEYAKNKGWYTRSLALSGGAKIIGADWINRGQDTLYLQKFDVDNSDGSLYVHQYMQNVQAPWTECQKMYLAYTEIGAIDSNLVFKIPIYNNMPNEEPTVDVEKVQQFVTRLYNVCLDREPDAEGLEYWTNILVKRERTGSQVGYGFAFSEEFKNHNYCNTCYAKQLYKAFLGREYDEGGLEHWVGKLNDGVTREEVLNGFLLSVEFGAICEEYGIDRGTGIAVPQYGTVAKGTCAGCGESDNVTQFITRLYSVCFNREPDVEGLNHNCELLWNHTITATQMAHGFIFSQEFLNLGLDDSAFLDSLYRSMMDREADEEGKNYWMDKLANGTSREEVFMGFAKSVEFNNLCKRYGVSN